MKNLFLVIAILATFSACGDNSTVTTNTTIITDSNKTEETKPEVILPDISPYGEGTLFDPFIIKENGIYKSDIDTYYKTSPIQAGCQYRFIPTDNEVYAVYSYDTHYTYLTVDINSTYTAEVDGSHFFNVISYVPTALGFYSECLNNK